MGWLWVAAGPCRNENGREDTKTEKQAAAIGANPAGYQKALHLPTNMVAIAAVAVTTPRPFNDLADHGANCGANDLISRKFKREAGIRGGKARGHITYTPS